MYRILLVEGSPESAHYLTRLISRGIDSELVLAATSNEALDRVRSQQIDMVIVDVRLPHIDGFDFCSRIHELDSQQSIPVLLLSAHQDQPYPDVKALSLGPGEIYTIPTPGSNLIAWINILLKINSIQLQVADQPRMAAAGTDDARKIQQLLLNHASDALLWLDAVSGIIEHANSSAESKTGFPADLLKNKRLSDLVPNDKREETELIWNKSLQSDKISVIDLTLLRRSGMHTKSRLSLEPHRMNGADGIVIKIEDPPEAAADTGDEGARSLGDLSEFVRALSHEVRNPLTGISTNVQYMQMAFSDNETQVEIYSEILEAVKRLDTMFTEIVEYVRPMELKMSRINLTEMIRDLLNDHDRETLARRGIEVDVQFDWSAPEIEADAARLHRALSIILHHCIREADDKSQLLLAGKNLPEGLQLSFSYNGHGFNTQQLKKLYTPVSALNSPDPGMGLAYVKKIVDEHDFRLDVESQIGNRTQFTLTIPLKRTLNG
ncbi:response regulator [bacterium]|nr:response regulator [bacterium]